VAIEEEGMGATDIDIMTEAEVTLDERSAAGQWRIYWGAVWVGALAALSLALICGLSGTALGAHKLGPGRGIATWKDLSLWGAIFSVCGAFFSFVVGGWVAGRIAGFRRSEPAMLHGAIVWLIAVPLFVGLAAFGAGALFGSWYSGLATTPPWLAPANVTADPQPAAAARNTALSAVTALLLGLVGAVIGGWMASGEPMTLTYYRTRESAPRRRSSLTSPPTAPLSPAGRSPR
jgi:hypothetical protein